MISTKHIISNIMAAGKNACRKIAIGCFVMVCFVMACAITTSCEREPMLHLHDENASCSMKIPTVDFELQVLWDYLFDYDSEYDWKAEWLYGWDEKDQELFVPC